MFFFDNFNNVKDVSVNFFVGFYLELSMMIYCKFLLQSKKVYFENNNRLVC